MAKKVSIIALHSSKNGILLLKLFWSTVRKNCSSDQKKKLLKFITEEGVLRSNTIEELQFKLKKVIGI